MQNDSQDGHYGSAQTPIHPNLMSFPSTSAEFFYPMSAPATAPVFHNTKPFWDPDSSMGGMDLDFSADDAGMFNMESHKMSNSFEWGRNNTMFQETVHAPPVGPNIPIQSESTAAKRQRPLAPKLPITRTDSHPTMAPFNFTNGSTSDDPFSTVNVSGVDPGLLYTQNNLVPMPSEFEDVPLPALRPVTSHVEMRPYQHQLRESRRDQEELHRSRSSREGSRTRRLDRGTVSSPVRGSARPGLSRSMSESRGKRPPGKSLASKSRATN